MILSLLDKKVFTFDIKDENIISHETLLVLMADFFVIKRFDIHFFEIQP